MKFLNLKLWMAALSVLLLIGCHKDSCSPRFNPIPLNPTPTNDVVNNVLDNSALVIGANSSPECVALQRRLINITTGGLGDPNLHTLVIGAAQLNTLGEQDAGYLRNVVVRGGNILVLSPDAASIGKLSQILGRAVDMPMLPQKDQPIALMAVKRGKTYLSFNRPEDVTSNDYLMGKRIDKLVDWLKALAAPVSFHANLKDDVEQALQDLCSAQEITLDMGIDIYVKTGDKSGWGTYHDISLVYYIWKAHSFGDDNRDFYCIKEEITAYNNELGCGPENEEDWTEVSKDWDMWRKAQEAAGQDPDNGENYVYGPYMHYIGIDNFLTNDAGQSLTVVGYDPENSTSGGATVTENFSMSLGGSMGCGTSGPSASASIGLSWGTSVAKFSPDLAATANLTTSGEVSWTYKGSRPGTHWEFADIGEHDLAASILKNTCTLHQAWIWSIPASGKGVVHLVGNFQATDEWLSIIEDIAETHEVYFGPDLTTNWTYDIVTPPQYKQQWSMTLEPVSEAAENYLINHLGADYYWTNSYFFTQKEEHTSTDKDDEISAYVAASKDLFDKNPDIMKKAAEAGGLTSGYTIIWQNLNGPDDSNFTYEVKL